MLRTTSQKQLAGFDYGARFEEHIHIQRLWPILSPVLATGPTVLDIGGGTGQMADYCLARHPQSSWIVADNSADLLAKNVVNERKKILYGSAENLDIAPNSVNLVLMHRVLHHMVGDTYRESLDLIRVTLRQAHTLLRENGYLSLLENCYEGSSRLLYWWTSSKLLAPVIHKMGSNTAGVGVCYLPCVTWQLLLEKTGFRVVESQEIANGSLPWYARVATLARRAHVVHFWCARI